MGVDILNYEITQQLLDAISPYFDLNGITITTENKDWKGRSYRSDFVKLIYKNNVSFEVFDNEIIISYFTDHVHFEDYIFDLEDGEPDFVTRAREFLVQLFTMPIRRLEKYRGKTLVSDQYFFVMPDGQEERIGGTWYGLVKLINPFAKKHTHFTTWYYDIKKNCFTAAQPWKPDPNAVEVIKIADKYIEIFEKRKAFTFTIWQKEYDDYYCMYYWTPLDHGVASYFDTKKKAIEAAKEMLK